MRIRVLLRVKISSQATFVPSEIPHLSSALGRCKVKVTPRSIAYKWSSDRAVIYPLVGSRDHRRLRGRVSSGISQHLRKIEMNISLIKAIWIRVPHRIVEAVAIKVQGLRIAWVWPSRIRRHPAPHAAAVVPRPEVVIS